MVDFRARPLQYPDKYIDVMSKNSLGTAIEATEKGFLTGLGITKEVTDMVQKKKQRERLSELAQNPEFQKLDEDMGMPEGFSSEMIKQGDLKEIGTLATNRAKINALAGAPSKMKDYTTDYIIRQAETLRKKIQGDTEMNGQADPWDVQMLNKVQEELGSRNIGNKKVPKRPKPLETDPNKVLTQEIADKFVNDVQKQKLVTRSQYPNEAEYVDEVNRRARILAANQGYVWEE